MLTPTGRLIILLCGFLGWLCAGVHMSITSQMGRPAAIDLLANTGALDRTRFADLERLFDDRAHSFGVSSPT